MKIALVDKISTDSVAILGIALAVPAFMQIVHEQIALLSFNIVGSNNAQQWCNDPSSWSEDNVCWQLLNSKLGGSLIWKT